LVLLAVADDSISPAVLRRAGRELAESAEAFAEVGRPAAAYRRPHPSGPRHPLARSAVYQAASILQRSTAHGPYHNTTVQGRGHAASRGWSAAIPSRRT
jgi:hypothetical protein